MSLMSETWIAIGVLVTLFLAVGLPIVVDPYLHPEDREGYVPPKPAQDEVASDNIIRLEDVRHPSALSEAA